MAPSSRHLKKAFFCLIVLPGLPFVFGSLAIVIYANWPANPGLKPVQAWPSDTRALTLVTHGTDDNVANWAQPLAQLWKSSAADSSHAEAIDWADGADSLFRCSRNASVIGKQLAERAASHLPQLESVHFVAHSAGSFMAHAFCKELKSQRPEVKISIDYLDPAGIYRGLFWNFGRDNFGSCADQARNLFNVGDGVPGSEEPLTHSQNTNITALRPTDIANGHMWPVWYYLDREKAALVE